MSETVDFRKYRRFLGRNGVAKMSAIHISRQGDDLYVAPVTSRGLIGRAYMLVPVDMAPEVARAMLRLCAADTAEDQAA